MSINGERNLPLGDSPTGSVDATEDTEDMATSCPRDGMPTADALDSAAGALDSATGALDLAVEGTSTIRRSGSIHQGNMNGNAMMSKEPQENDCNRGQHIKVGYSRESRHD